MGLASEAALHGFTFRTKSFHWAFVSILERSDEATRTAQRAARGEAGILRIGFVAATTTPILPLLVQAYLRRYPDVELQLHLLSPDQQLAAFDKATLDLGFSRPLPPERRRSFDEEVVYIDHLAALLPPKHPLTNEARIRLEQLASEPFVLVHRAGASGLFDEAVAMCRRAGFSPQIRHEPELLTTVFVLVESGLGVSLVPSCARGFERQKSVRRPLAVQSDPIPLCAAWLRGSHSPTRDAFLDVLRTQKPAIQKCIAGFVRAQLT
ncbi:MAG: LysR family substrate-binding domain-containing protein [Verrucomicrobia bacterium]|nr:LysR family substrate-binding domain-containing protein [Verrucomicrobiota bacterium]